MEIFSIERILDTKKYMLSRVIFEPEHLSSKQLPYIKIDYEKGIKNTIGQRNSAGDTREFGGPRYIDRS